MVELIFLHLPKTGGSSILEALKFQYGSEHVRHFERDECLDLNKRGIKISEVLSPETKVIHGHIRYQEIKDIARRDKPKLVTFFRDPVARVISNYRWWQHSLIDKPDHPAYSRRKDALELYIQEKTTQNKMSYFLKGVSLGRFTFIGFLETFDEDLEHMGKLLEWTPSPHYHEKNLKAEKAKKDTNISDAIINQIKRLNSKDIALFEKAKKLKLTVS